MNTSLDTPIFISRKLIRWKKRKEILQENWYGSDPGKKWMSQVLPFIQVIIHIANICKEHGTQDLRYFICFEYLCWSRLDYS